MYLTVLALSAAIALPLASAYPVKTDGLHCRSGPGTNHGIVKTYAKGTELTISCQTPGTDVNGDSLWDKTSDGCYVTDYYVLTGTSNYVAPRCDSSSGGSGGAVSFEGIPSVGVLFRGDVNKHYCTASVVESKHGNVILTAGHCISGSGKGISFAPGYHDGKTPYGVYPVTAAYVDANWNKDHNIDYDFAFLTLGNGVHDGKSVNVQSVVGGNKLVTNAGYKETVEVVGYNDNQQKPVHCHVGTYEEKSGQLGFNCGPFSSGTSGSPWIAGYNTKTKNGNVIGNIGGLHTGGCSASTSYSSKYGAGTLATFNRANDGSAGDEVRGGATSGC